MKIAITADVHLTTRAQHPERFEALENLLADLRSQDITTLLIAGDLFDASRHNYAEFEQLCRDPENKDLHIYVIPGNHDPAIDQRKIVADNLRIITTPTIHPFDGRPILFLPYQADETMGEALAPLADQLPPRQWVLVGHGDWAGGLRSPNPAEPGVYMPLTRQDIDMFQPARVFLGHIHAPMDAPPVHYAGSPCGLDISETGRRRYLVYDTLSGEVESCTITTPVLYYDETFVIVPANDEAAYLEQQIASRQRAWGLSAEEQASALIRVKVKGYSADRAALRATLQAAFAGYSFYKDQPPDIDDVHISDDLERHYIVEQVRTSLENLAISAGQVDPSADDILLKAMHIVYGG